MKRTNTYAYATWALLALTLSFLATAQPASATALSATDLAARATTCRTGLVLLQANLYKYPDRPDAAPAGKKSWEEAYGLFRSANLPACLAVEGYLSANASSGIAKPAREVMKADGVTAFIEYFDGRAGIVAQGERILGYCPALHRSQFDCVSASDRIGNQSIPSVTKILDRLAALECEPATGWSGCRKVAIGTGSLEINASAAASVKAQKAVESIYSTILSKLKTAYPESRFNGYKVYLTNGEPWSELKSLPPMGFMGSDEQNDELRGGTTASYLWISEQMICKKGVATRNAANAAGKRDARDDDDRTFDQVVHEFAHAIDFKFGLEAQYKTSIFPGSPPDYPAVEAWAWGVQHYFQTPSGTLNTAQRAFLGKIFESAGANPFQCSVLMPK